MSFDIATIEKLDAVQVFINGGIDPLLKAITDEVRSYVPDTSTDKGRKAIASLAYKCSQSKTLLDAAGKNLVSDWKENAKKVDIVRKSTRDFLDALRDEARAPLTAWEEAENARIEAEQLAEQISRDFDEATAMNALIDREREVARKEEEQRKAEEERLAKEAAVLAEKQRLEREEQIRKEAAEKAERDAREAIERAEREAKEAVERVEREKREAAERAEKEKRESEIRAEIERREAEERQARAVRAEAERIEREKEAERLAKEKREQDEKHKAKINRAAVACLVKHSGLSEDKAKSVVIAIAKGFVDNVTINY